MKKTPGESVVELTQDIHHTVQIAHFYLDASAKESLVLDQFVQSMGDQDLAVWGPSFVSQAANAATQCELAQHPLWEPGNSSIAVLRYGLPNWLG